MMKPKPLGPILCPQCRFGGAMNLEGREYKIYTCSGVGDVRVYGPGNKVKVDLVNPTFKLEDADEIVQAALLFLIAEKLEEASKAFYERGVYYLKDLGTGYGHAHMGACRDTIQSKYPQITSEILPDILTDDSEEAAQHYVNEMFRHLTQLLIVEEVYRENP